MKRSNPRRRNALLGLALPLIALMVAGAQETKQKIDAGGLTFQAPASWKSSAPANEYRRAQLKVDPIEGDAYPAELVVTYFQGGAGSVEANLERWRRQFKDKDGSAPRIESKKVRGKNVDVTRAEISGHYVPPQFGVHPEPERDDARLLGAIVMTDSGSFFLKMVGPNRTMTKIRPDFEELLASIAVEAK
jgi:hypothetical protein